MSSAEGQVEKRAQTSYHPNTTDGNGNVLSFRTDTTGAGATPQMELSALRANYTTHDHATRSSNLSMFVTNAGTLTEAMSLASSGNVGIGTSAPSAKLEIRSESSGEMIWGTRYQSVVNGANLKLNHARGTAAAPLKLNDLDQGGYIDFLGYARNAADTADDFVELGYIAGIVDGVDGQGRVGGALQFLTAPPSSATRVERLRISATGNVGIGTTNPARKLHISDAMRLEPIASPPASPAKGDIYYDTSDALCAYIGVAWVVIGGAGSCN